MVFSRQQCLLLYPRQPSIFYGGKRKLSSQIQDDSVISVNTRLTVIILIFLIYVKRQPLCSLIIILEYYLWACSNISAMTEPIKVWPFPQKLLFYIGSQRSLNLTTTRIGEQIKFLSASKFYPEISQEQIKENSILMAKPIVSLWL